MRRHSLNKHGDVRAVFFHLISARNDVRGILRLARACRPHGRLAPMAPHGRYRRLRE